MTKGAMNLKENKEWYVGEREEGGNDIFYYNLRKILKMKSYTVLKNVT